MFSNEKGLFKKAKEAKVLPNIITALLWTFLFLIGGEIIGGLVGNLTKKIIGTNPAVLM